MRGSPLTFQTLPTGSVVVHLGDPVAAALDGQPWSALGEMTQPEAVRTAGALLRAAVGGEAFAVLASAAQVGLDGADEESTGHTAEVLDEAWQALAWLQGQTSSAEARA